jgi:hypothetical protein
LFTTLHLRAIYARGTIDAQNMKTNTGCQENRPSNCDLQSWGTAYKPAPAEGTTTTKRLLSIVALAAGVLALTYGAADAITVTFNDLTDTVSADVTDVPAGVTISITSPVPGALTPESIRVVITGAFVPPEELTDGSATNLVLTEGPVVQPPESPLNIASDLISVVSTPPFPPEEEAGVITIHFISDLEGPLFNNPCIGNFLCKFEGDANPLLTFSLLNSQGDPFTPSARLVINAFSDVPEPTTLLLLGSGLAGLAALGGLKHRRSLARGSRTCRVTSNLIGFADNPSIFYLTPPDGRPVRVRTKGYTTMKTMILAIATLFLIVSPVHAVPIEWIMSGTIGTDFSVVLSFFSRMVIFLRGRTRGSQISPRETSAPHQGPSTSSVLPALYLPA